MKSVRDHSLTDIWLDSEVDPIRVRKKGTRRAHNLDSELPERKQNEVAISSYDCKCTPTL